MNIFLIHNTVDELFFLKTYTYRFDHANANCANAFVGKHYRKMATIEMSRKNFHIYYMANIDVRLFN